MAINATSNFEPVYFENCRSAKFRYEFGPLTRLGEMPGTTMPGTTTESTYRSNLKAIG